MHLTKQQLENALIERHGAETQRRLSHATVGIAGLGGLGSHIADSLARLGVGRLVLVDCDRVDISNLNRQRYTTGDIGTPKPEALRRHLLEINPYLTYTTAFVRVTAANAACLFTDCDLVCEAFDLPDEKAMLTETLLSAMPALPLIGASGMAGTDSGNSIHTVRRLRNYYLCGDGQSALEDGLSLYAPRVALCAAQQATMAMRILLGKTEP